MPGPTQDNVFMIVDMVKHTYVNQIRANSWLDEYIKERAVMKLKTITTFAGYPDYLFNDAMLSELYAEVHKDIVATAPV